MIMKLALSLAFLVATLTTVSSAVTGTDSTETKATRTGKRTTKSETDEKSSSSSSPSYGLENELWDEPEDIELENHYHSPLPHTYIRPEDVPESFSWDNVSGKSYLTHSLNQHIPQYCGSCWAHASLSSLADRIKIARRGSGNDINLSVQFILNCGKVAGSCHGGSNVRLYKFIHETGYVPYDTCQPYLACSSESVLGFCPYIDTTCTPMNVCRTCTHEGKCYAIDVFPNATVAEYGSYRHASTDILKAEIYARGPVAASVHGAGLSDYHGGVYTNTSASHHTTHAISIVGWGKMDDGSDESYWIIRNSWGQYWGESLGYARILMGYNVLGIESHITWATPGTFTIVNYPCAEDGNNCRSQDDENIDKNQGGSDGSTSAVGSTDHSFTYIDPSTDPYFLSRHRQL